MKDVQKSTLVNVIVSLGIILFLLVACFSFFTADKVILQFLVIAFLSLQLILGIMALVFALIKTHKATHLFIGSILSIWAVLFFMVRYVLPLSLKQIWPVFSFIAGLLLFLSGFYKYHKLKFGYTIPSFALFIMGIWYSFFSFGIIKTSFRVVVRKFGPFFILGLGIILFAIFTIQKRNKKFLVSDDETGSFSDEDDEIVKQDE